MKIPRGAFASVDNRRFQLFFSDLPPPRRVQAARPAGRQGGASVLLDHIGADLQDSRIATSKQAGAIQFTGIQERPERYESVPIEKATPFTPQQSEGAHPMVQHQWYLV